MRRLAEERLPANDSNAYRHQLLFLQFLFDLNFMRKLFFPAGDVDAKLVDAVAQKLLRHIDPVDWGFIEGEMRKNIDGCVQFMVKAYFPISRCENMAANIQSSEKKDVVKIANMKTVVNASLY